ncbi:MAG: hypothetical protein E6767_01310 [Dysgonomonas sp.]|nr:hypothetical protein [Dysgonomonas sp.]
MENEFDYYLPLEMNSANTPLLMGNIIYIQQSQAPKGHIAQLVFRSPNIRKPDINTDYLQLDTNSVFSKKIHDALINIPIEEFQLVPALIWDQKKGIKYENFYIANAYKKISSFDKEKTIYWKISDLTGAWVDIEKINLDKNILSKIPLEERLIYTSAENSAFVLYHKTIVDIILSTNPKGVNFIPVEEWNNDTFFSE